jgi:hypothetical protein
MYHSSITVLDLADLELELVLQRRGFFDGDLGLGWWASLQLVDDPFNR